MENYIKSLHYKPLTTEKKKGHSNELRVEKWKWFSLKEISNVYTGDDLILSMVDDGEIPVATLINPYPLKRSPLSLFYCRPVSVPLRSALSKGSPDL